MAAGVASREADAPGEPRGAGMVQVSTFDWAVVGVVALAVGAGATYLWRHWLARTLRHMWPRSDASLGVVNSVIGVVVSLAAVPAPWSVVIALAVAAIGVRQYATAERDYRRRERDDHRRELARKADFWRRSALIIDQLEVFTQGIIFRTIRNSEERKVADLADPVVRDRLDADLAKIERKKPKNLARFNIGCSSELIALLDEMEEQYEIDGSEMYALVSAASRSFDSLCELRKALPQHFGKLNDV